MAHKFQIGDRVRVAFKHSKQDWPFEVGDEGEVMELSSRPWVCFDRQINSDTFPLPSEVRRGQDTRCFGAAYEKELELIAASTTIAALEDVTWIAPGTRVRVRPGYCGAANPGQEGTVIEDDDCPWIVFDDYIGSSYDVTLPEAKRGHMDCIKLDRLERLEPPVSIEGISIGSISNMDLLQAVLNTAHKVDQQKTEEGWADVIKALCEERGVTYDVVHRKATLLRLLGEELPEDVRAELPTNTGVANAGSVGGW